MQFTVAVTLNYIWLEQDLNRNQPFHSEGNVWYLSCFDEWEKKKRTTKILEFDFKI